MIGTARDEVPRRVAVVGGGITGLLAAVGFADAIVDARRGPPCSPGAGTNVVCPMARASRPFATVAGGHLPHPLPRRVAPRRRSTVRRAATGRWSSAAGGYRRSSGPGTSP
jgi:glycine/D-amino acid oxidase-like deaminating enzyme